MSKYKVVKIENGGLQVNVCNLGGTIMSLYAPDAKGKKANVLLGYEKPADYLKQNGCFGALIGRVCNRISNASAVIDGKKYKFFANNNTNSLHGGNAGFHTEIWDMREISGDGFKGVNLHYISPDMAGGYPGNLDVSVNYKVTDDAELILEYSATTDKPTLCALTNHAYFNLSGGEAENILDHHIKINSAFYTPIDKVMAPTGEVASVANTALDLRKYKAIRVGVESDDELIKAVGGGYDHNYILPNDTRDLIEAAVVYEPITGRVMEVFTDEVGIQLYTGNFISKRKGIDGAVYDKHSGFCLETQHWPNAANIPHFPSIELYPGEVYSSTTVYKFSAM